MKSYNLWSMLVHHGNNCVESEKEVYRETMIALGGSARFHYQELSLEPDSKGWKISVFGCDEDDVGAVEIFVPRDRHRKVTVVDTSRITWRHKLARAINRWLRV